MSIYLLLGSEVALADRALVKLNEQFRTEGAEVTALSAPDTIVGDIADALAPSLFAEKRALILRDLQDLPADNASEITRFLADPDPTITVVFTHKGGVKGKALLDKIKKANAQIIACETLKKATEKQDFVRQLLLDIGRKATPGAIKALVNAVGTDLRELQATCTQIASDTVGVIDEEMVEKYHQGRIETTGFDVADAALDDDVTRALLTLRNALQSGTDPVMVTSAIASSLRGLAKVSGANRGTKSFDLAGPLGMAPWQIEKARRQLASWPPGRIAHAVGLIALADAQVKGASVDPIYALESAVAQIVASRS